MNDQALSDLSRGGEIPDDPFQLVAHDLAMTKDFAINQIVREIPF